MKRQLKWRSSSAVLVAVWLVLPLLGAVHGLTEAHRYCAKHHAFEDVGPGHVDARRAHDAVSKEHQEPQTGHTACAFSQFVHREALTAHSVAPGAVTIDHPIAVVHVRPHDGRCIRLLAVAPKTSPPGHFLLV